MSVPTKQELLKKAEALCYNDRIKLAATIAKENKDSPQLAALIKELRTHPDPAVPKIEDDNNNNLPRQERNVCKFYSEDQLAVFAAAASKTNLAILKDELRSPSMFLKQLAITEFVKQEKSDDVLYEEIMHATPFVRRKLIHACIRDKRMKLLDKLHPVITKESGPEASLDFLHGCTPEFIAANLTPENLESGKATGYRVEEFARHYPEIVISKMASLFKGSTSYDISQSWSRVATILDNAKTQARSHKMSEAILDLAIKYTPFSYNRSYYATDALDDLPYKSFELPSCISGSLKHFAKCHPEKLFKLLKSTIHINYVGKIIAAIPDQFWSYQMPYELLKDLLIFICAKSSPATLFKGSDSLDRKLLGNVQKSLPKLSITQMIEISKILFGHFSAIKSSDNEEQEIVDSIVKGFLQAGLRLVRDRLKLYLAEIKTTQKEEIRAEVEKQKKSQFNLDSYLNNSNDDENNNNNNNVKFEDKIKLTKADPAKLKQFDEFASYFLQLLLQNYIKLETLAKHEISTYTVTEFTSIIKRFPSLIYPIWVAVRPAADEWFKPGELEDESETNINNAKSLTQHFLNLYNKNHKYKAFPADIQAQCGKHAEEIFSYLFGHFSQNPLQNVDHLIGMMGDNKEQNNRIFKAFNTKQLQDLAKTKSNTLISLLDNLDDVEYAKTFLKDLMDEGVSTKAIREYLQRFQDIKDAKVRNTLQKATDSSSQSDRVEAIKALVQSTNKSKSVEEMSKTLTFLRKKLKNESSEQRAAGLSAILCSIPRHYLNNALFEHWFNYLSDALQSQDLDSDQKGNDFVSHPVLQHFNNLSVKAMEIGMNERNYEIFNFGVEIAWRVSVFRNGEKEASAVFNLKHVCNTCSSVLADPDRGSTFAEMYLKALGERISAKNPEWAKNPSYYTPLLKAAGRNYKNIKLLNDLLVQNLANTKANTPKDSDGLYILAKDATVVVLFETILNYEWHTDPLLVEYSDLLLHSRLAAQVIPNYIKQISSVKGKIAKRKAKDEFVMKLLSITPSAIHLRFVWRYLVNYRQDKLDEYINKAKSFRGLFYVDSENRPLARKLKQSKAATVSRRAANSRGRARGRARASRPARRVPAGRRGVSTKLRDLPYAPSSLKLLEEKIKTEREQEATIEGEVVDGDHPHFFIVEGVYGLHRLLPRQTSLLASQWKSQIFNPNRSIPQRVQAAIRWTLMPTTSYTDIVNLVQSLDAETTPVNIVEALTKGFMRNDEPCAPLHYLFSEGFLNSDRAKIAFYAASRCFKFLPEGAMTKTIDNMLNGKQRYNVKITIYKQMMRMLLSQPNEANMQVISREWNRKDLHRDVRITILQLALRLLDRPKQGEAAWRIIQMASLHPNPEVVISLLGFANNFVSSSTHKDLFQKSKLGEHIDTLPKIELPSRFAPKYAREVVLRLAETAEDDDIKFLATSCLKKWYIYDMQDQSAEVLFKLLTNFDNSLLRSPKSFDKKLFFARCKHVAQHLVRITGCLSDHTTEKKASRKFFLDTIDQLCKKILTESDRNIRANMFSLLNSLLSSISITNFSADEYNNLVTILSSMGATFDEQLATYEVNRFPLTPTNHDIALALIHKMFLKSISTGSNHYYDAIRGLPSRYINVFNNSALVFPFIQAALDAKLVPDFKPSAEYKTMCLNHVVYLLSQHGATWINNHPEHYLRYVETLCQEAHPESKTFNGSSVTDMVWSTISNFLSSYGIDTTYIEQKKVRVVSQRALNDKAKKVLDYFINKYLDQNINNNDNKPGVALDVIRHVVLQLFVNSSYVRYVVLGYPDKLFQLLHTYLMLGGTAFSNMVSNLMSSFNEYVYYGPQHANKSERQKPAFINMLRAMYYFQLEDGKLSFDSHNTVPKEIVVKKYPSSYIRQLRSTFFNLLSTNTTTRMKQLLDTETLSPIFAIINWSTIDSNGITSFLQSYFNKNLGNKDEDKKAKALEQSANLVAKLLNCSDEAVNTLHPYHLVEKQDNLPKRKNRLAAIGWELLTYFGPNTATAESKDKKAKTWNPAYLALIDQAVTHPIGNVRRGALNYQFSE